MSDEAIRNEAEMLRRAATATRSLIAQVGRRGEWAAWVPTHLEEAADRIDPRPDYPTGPDGVGMCDVTNPHQGACRV